jgi:hypothetical protein
MGDTRIPTLDDLDAMELDSVAVEALSESELRLLVWDPEGYPAHDPFLLIFTGSVLFSGPPEFGPVRIGRQQLQSQTKYLFLEAEIVPTEGKAVQVWTGNQGTEIRHGTEVEKTVAQVVADCVRIERPSE